MARTFRQRAQRLQRAAVLRYLKLTDSYAYERRKHREWNHARKRRYLAKYIPAGGVGAEVGVFWAHFSEILHEDFAPSKLHLVDPWDLVAGEFFHFTSAYTLDGKLPTKVAMAAAQALAERSAGKVEVHRAYSYDFFPNLPDESLDWVYLDAAHSYEAVSEDLRHIWPKLKPTGILFGDDFFEGSIFPGVRRAVREFARLNEIPLAAGPYQQYLLFRPDAPLPPIKTDDIVFQPEWRHRKAARLQQAARAPKNPAEV
ncbi:MAG: class I SAM-dependent methyltransferase [Pseudomonadota bacterium]